MREFKLHRKSRYDQPLEDFLGATKVGDKFKVGDVQAAIHKARGFMPSSQYVSQHLKPLVESGDLLKPDRMTYVVAPPPRAVDIDETASEKVLERYGVQLGAVGAVLVQINARVNNIERLVTMLAASPGIK